MKCREKVEIKNPKAITIKNGRPATQGECPGCGTMIYTHVLNRGPAGVRSPSMRFEGVMEGFMLIRIRHRDKDSALTQGPDISPVRTEAMLHSQASYTAIATVFGVLCGSI